MADDRWRLSMRHVWNRRFFLKESHRRTESPPETPKKWTLPWLRAGSGFRKEAPISCVPLVLP